MYDGDSLNYIVLASGKAMISLQHELPIVTVAGSQIGEILNNNRLEFMLDKIEELPDYLSNYDSLEA